MMIHKEFKTVHNIQSKVEHLKVEFVNGKIYYFQEGT